MAMKIGGFQPVTMSDFPGRVAAIVFTQGCNFRCPYCHNRDLLPNDVPGRITPDTIYRILDRRRGRISGIVITGGEPCLQRDLVPFCRIIRDMGFALKLDTNGSRPEVIDFLLNDSLVDYIAMDIKAPAEKVSFLTGVPVKMEKIMQSIALIAASGIPHHFRTTDVPSMLSFQDHAAIRELVPPGAEHIVQPFIAAHALSLSLRCSPNNPNSGR